MQYNRNCIFIKRQYKKRKPERFPFFIQSAEPVLLFEGIDLVGAFPGKETVFGCTAKVTIGRSGCIDGIEKSEGIDDASGFEVENFADAFGDDFLIDGSGAERIDEDADGFSDADGVGELDFTFFGEPCGDDIFGDVACHVAGGAVDFGGVFAGEGATAVTSHTAVGVDDDFTACESAVALGTADDESSGGVDMEFGSVAQQVCGQAGLDDEIHDGFMEFFFGNFFAVLSGDDDGVNASDFAIGIADSDLAFAIGAEEVHDFALANFGEFSCEFVGEHDGGGHEFGCFVASEAEHKPLVAGALFFDDAFVGIDALSDVRALGFNGDENAAGFIVETLQGAVIADFLDGTSSDFGNICPSGGSHFAGDDEHAGFEKCFASHMTAFVLGDDFIKDGIADLVSNFIGMSFGNRLTCKQIIAFVHSTSHKRKFAERNFQKKGLSGMDKKDFLHM